MELTEDIGRNFARAALGHVMRPFPYKDDHVFESEHDVRAPRDAHPVFFGSYDWHSCVHGWWTLLTLRRLFPEMPEAEEIAALADETFTEEKLAVELAYLERPSARGFERPYGWGWLLFLHLEASRHGDRDWGRLLEPMARLLAKRLREYLAILTYPITVGTHFNTAFALMLASEWAETWEPEMLEDIAVWARKQFLPRKDYRGWEPGGDEFLSPVLTAATLMQWALPREEWVRWFDELVIDNGWLESECLPVTVSDRSDGKIAHLDGLNLSRAFCLWEMVPYLHDRPELIDLLKRRARLHLEASLPHVTGDYMGEHWLASFALLALLSR
ncbi:DUF2891 domain-containing protein [Qipengyuania sp. 1XM1-15A]|uniref:DUF2891 domain-containing protein n=1 Tax=Qipengyuania xiamenensis TaxID=2867237 RepID=UPI001C88E12F|nr:DUF2891 domain-containing protein [Qipengyuania xiamenensis]